MMEPKWLWLWLWLSVLLLEGCRWCSTDACWEEERIALLQLKPFFNRLNDLSSWVEEAKGSDCCQWEGVECDTSSSRRVIGLFLNFTRYKYWDLAMKVKYSWYLNASLFLPFKEMKRLYLPRNCIAGCVENEDFAKLSMALDNLEILDLSFNYLNDTILLSLSQLSSLKHLYLGGNSFTGSSHANGFQWLSRLNNLETLELWDNSLKNSIFFQMGAISSLKKLDLAENLLKGTIYIHELNNLTNLKKLDLSYNSIESLRSLNQGNETQLKLINLEVLDLSGNLFRNNAFSFLQGLSSLKSLYMSRNDLQGSLDITELNDLINLKTLYLRSNYIESLQSFKDSGRKLNMPHLEELHLGDNLINDKVFASIKGLSHLKYLDISYNQLKGSIDMKDLSAFTNLEELDMSSNDLNEFLAHNGYKSLRKLKILHLEEAFTNGSIPLLLKLVEAFPSVKTFNLQRNYLNTTMAAQELHTGRNVEEIFLDDSYLNNNILQSIGVLTSLKILSFKRCGLVGSLPNQGWCDLRKLEQLDISRNELEGTLPYCLGNLTSLRVLDISYNQFNGHLTSLANLTSLKVISLSRNRFQISMSFIPLANLSNLKVFLSDENRLMMEPSSFHLSIPKFQLNFISLSKCTGDQELSLKPPNFLYYQYDLRYVDLSYNNFSGTVPLWLLVNNTKLKDLFLTGNSLTGPFLLPQLLNPNTSSIDISNNRLQGQIPANICSTFPNLMRLVLSKNALEGNIPHCLSGVSSLLFLDLSNNQLSGRVPEELFMRSSLITLRLSNNYLNGKIVPAIFNSSMLSELYLDGNNFAGEMPNIDISSINFPYSLVDIDLSNNSLHGKLPRWIGNVSSLRRLALSDNQFKGFIPKELCNLYQLEFLELSENNLSGSIPSCFNQPYLRHVHLNRNRLSGQWAYAFYNSSSLVTLDLRENSLTGTIPKWIGTLSSLSVLLLKANHLDGGIPVQLCKLYSLSIIDLSKNMFSGRIPSCLGNLTLATRYEKYSVLSNQYIMFPTDVSTYIGMMVQFRISSSLYYPDSYFEEWVEFTTKKGFLSYSGDILELMSGIDLSCNKLTGQIPDEMGNLTEIHALNLSHNTLIGVIPSSFSKLKQIESLDLSYNKLSGRIPIQLVELNSLEVFSVAHNNLSGGIPEPKAQFGTFDESSYEGNLFLCGPPLHKNCSKTNSPSMVPTKLDDEEGSFIDTYFFCVSFVVSYVAVLLAIFVVLYINPHWRQTWFSFIEGCITACRYSILGNFLELYVLKRCVYGSS